MKWLLALVALFLAAPAYAQRPTDDMPPVALVQARHGMVVSQEARATRVGVAILDQGGNAVDAAVATGFALAVTYPRAGNIGGGGFLLIRMPDGRATAIDHRETAPAATTREAFLDARGEPDPKKSRELGSAVGVPGTVAGLAMAHERYGSGRFTLADLIRPAIALARDGIPVENDVADSLPNSAPRLARWPASARIFLRTDGSALREGDTLVQADLAATLASIAEQGPRAFYEGPIAEKLARAVQASGGAMTADDLRDYRAIERTPVAGNYRGHEILSMPPPSAGGVLLLQMLAVLEGFPPADDPTQAHRMVEAMKRAYADRARYLGDPDFNRAPVAALVSKRYAAAQRAAIDPERATPSRDLGPIDPAPFEGDNTTHVSVMDRDGGAVSYTTTLNLSYGTGIVADGTGVLLNNELDDFAARPGAPNAFGLTSLNEANLPGPRKRPLSSMTPTIVTREGRVVLVTGSPGGSRIVTAVLQLVSNVIDRKMDVAAATGAARLHHQWLPDEVIVEPGIPAGWVRALEARGHRVTVRRPGTAVNSIAATPDGLTGAADTRTRGALAGGH